MVICKLQNTNAIEDEIHFTIDCSLHDDIRDSLIDKVVRLIAILQNITARIFFFLIISEEMFYSVAKPLHSMLIGDAFL